MTNREVKILGHKYTIHERSREEDPKLNEANGYFDHSNNTIVICDLKEDSEDINSIANIDVYKNKVLRHEIIHAFLYESGLKDSCPWATEEMVDWLAIQFPKIIEAFDRLKILDYYILPKFNGGKIYTKGGEIDALCTEDNV